MSNCADADLISLADSPTSASPPDLLSPVSFGSIGKKTAPPNCRNGVHRDSFSDLVGAMRAKKPYTPLAPLNLRPSLPNTNNGMQYAPRNISGNSILSPTAKSFDAPLTVAKFLEQQDETPVTLRDSRHQQDTLVDLEARMSALNSELHSLTFDDATECQPNTPSPRLTPPPLPRFGPVDPSTPAQSVRPPVSAYDCVSEPTVRVTKSRWTSVLEEVDLLKKGKGELQMQLASLRKAHRAHLDTDHDVSAQLGKLKYQNEVNRDQKAAMGREIAQRDVMIKELRLDVDDLNNRIAELEIKLDQRTRVNGEAEYLRSTIRENDASHARDAETHQAAIHELELTVKRLTVERDVAVRANVHSGDHATRAQDLTEALTKREKMVTDLRQKMLEEQMRVTDLEDEVERLRELVNKENLDDIKEKLRAKSSDCDRFRTELKGTEHQLKLARSRLMTATNNGDLLRGAAHIVAPNEKCRLPKRVMACSGCYANNLPCDNGARCANCTLNNKKCARWRCSLKHKLMVCDRASCAPPHDPEGWLVSEPRPEW